MQIRRFCALLVVVFMPISVTCAQSAPNDKAATIVIRDEYLRAYNEHDIDAVLALYADDAVLLSEASVFRGKSEIRKWVQFAIEQGSVLESITPIREQSSDTLAYGTGQTKRLVGKEVHLGRYLLVLEKKNGRWRIIEHASFNAHD